MYLPLEELKKATQFTREGKLMEATSLIQQALGRSEAAATDPAPAPRTQGRPPHTQVLATEVSDVEFREATPAAQRTASAPASGTAATFDAHRFSSGGRSYAYRLYVPARPDDSPLPVIVMLHGCTQDSADFAAGTAMNEQAAGRGCIVVYPEQLARANSMRCWNWFEPAHQRRGGEPAMIAALAQHVVQKCNGDAKRVYVAGLSAGGAMAVLAGQLYPEVFAAIGVHSGLPAASATDVQSAQAAMRRPPRTPGARLAGTAAVPTIVFHGRSDRTVHPENGRQVVEQAAARAAAAGIALQRDEQEVTLAGRPVKRAVYRDAGQVRRLEHWEIGGAAHAWSGGSAAGSYTDVAGPGASAAMVDFFLEQRLGSGADCQP
ncbi:MAG TPA: PHB depolymerase family esterase [Ramlibacter sp.]|jgi:poly(hydroxyalkanoate) depolymerase family esterase|nr:PHB depolymerase family esterase [Ramlibacter sp.]